MTRRERFLIDAFLSLLTGSGCAHLAATRWWPLAVAWLGIFGGWHVHSQVKRGRAWRVSTRKLISDVYRSIGEPVPVEFRLLSDPELIRELGEAMRALATAQHGAERLSSCGGRRDDDPRFFRNGL